MPRGRTPKPAHLRQNRTKKAGATTLTDAPKRRRAPRLPDPGVDDYEWHSLTKKWWSNVWSSPMADEYLDTDIDGLGRLAFLVNSYYHTHSLKLMSEIRLQEARFGLSPVDRSRLQWEVQKGEEAASRRRPASPKRDDDGDDFESYLKAIK